MIKYLNISLVLFVLISEHVYACKCFDPGKYDVVFEGTVLKINIDQESLKTDHYFEVYFKVEKALKGTSQSSVTVYTGTPLLCGVSYEIGKKYTVYAIRDAFLKTMYCYGR